MKEERELTELTKPPNTIQGMAIMPQVTFCFYLFFSPEELKLHYRSHLQTKD